MATRPGVFIYLFSFAGRPCEQTGRHAYPTCTRCNRRNSAEQLWPYRHAALEQQRPAGARSRLIAITQDSPAWPAGTFHSRHLLMPPRYAASKSSLKDRRLASKAANVLQLFLIRSPTISSGAILTAVRAEARPHHCILATIVHAQLLF